MKANLEGYAARLAGMNYDDNPYSWYSQNKEWNEWADGYVAAEIRLDELTAIYDVED